MTHFSYDEILRLHARSLFEKKPSIPDHDIFMFEAEQLDSQLNPQLQGVRTDQLTRALIDPELLSVEDIGIVGDGLGVVEHADFISGGYPLGNPIEEVY